jgi:hypothetical protein
MRYLTILGAYLVSCLVAGLVMMAATASALGPVDDGVAHFFGGALFVAPFIALFGAVPSLAVISFAERYDRRSALFYAAAGVAVALISMGAVVIGVRAAGFGEYGSRLGNGWLLRVGTGWTSLALAGLAAGLTYWWLAGRRG